MNNKLTILFLLVLAACTNNHKDNEPKVDNTRHFVHRVIDGDTFVLSTGERVRFIGMDTPETHHPRKPKEPYGKEATKFTKKMVEGKYVELKYDKQRYDRYKRLLAYVYVDGIFLNAELVKRGLARATEYKPNVKYSKLFKKLERQAKAKKLGIWSGRYME